MGLVVGLAAADPRRVLATGWPWAAAAIAVLLGSPSIVFQLFNGIHQAEMTSSLTGNAARLRFLPAQALALGPPVVAIWGAGLVALLRRPAWRPIREFGVAYLAVAVLLLLLDGQFYYTVGLLLVLYAVGATGGAGVGDARPGERVAAGASAPDGGDQHGCSAVVALPLLSLGVLGASPVPLMNPAAGDQVGWRTYTGQVAQAYRNADSPEQARSVVIADNYGEAGALDRFGGEVGLPPVVSGHNSLHDLAPPGDDVTSAVVVMQGDAAPAFLAGVFASCRDAGVLDNRVQVANEEQGTVIRVCRDPLGSWEELWPRFRYVGLSTFCAPCQRLNLD